MTTALWVVALVVLSTLHEFLILAWHFARESRSMSRMVGIGALINITGAAPLVVAIEKSSWYPLAAGIVGSAVGTVLGMHRASPNR